MNVLSDVQIMATQLNGVVKAIDEIKSTLTIELDKLVDSLAEECANNLGIHVGQHYVSCFGRVFTPTRFGFDKKLLFTEKDALKSLNAYSADNYSLDVLFMVKEFTLHSDSELERFYKTKDIRTHLDIQGFQPIDFFLQTQL